MTPHKEFKHRRPMQRLRPPKAHHPAPQQSLDLPGQEAAPVPPTTDPAPPAPVDETKLQEGLREVEEAERQADQSALGILPDSTVGYLAMTESGTRIVFVKAELIAKVIRTTMQQKAFPALTTPVGAGMFFADMLGITAPSHQERMEKLQVFLREQIPS